MGYVIEGVALAGVALDYKLNQHWSINFESANRWMNSDKLDTQESTNSSPYDFYNLTTFGVAYKFFKNTAYPPEKPR